MVLLGISLGHESKNVPSIIARWRHLPHVFLKTHTGYHNSTQVAPSSIGYTSNNNFFFSPFPLSSSLEPLEPVLSRALRPSCLIFFWARFYLASSCSARPSGSMTSSSTSSPRLPFKDHVIPSLLLCSCLLDASSLFLADVVQSVSLANLATRWRY